MNQGKLDMLKQEMTRVNMDVLGTRDGEGNGNPLQYSCLGKWEILWTEEPGRL